MSLKTRLGQLEKQLGNDDDPRRVIIWFGPHFREPWIERAGDTIEMHVPVPEYDVEPLDYLTDAMRREIRPGDSIVMAESHCNGRDVHLQTDISPNKRKPYRLDPSANCRFYELQDADGTWTLHWFSP
jgi:hypothetical protein